MGLMLDATRTIRGKYTLSADVSLESPGLAAVIGPSGGGKSTLLALIAGFVQPDVGRVMWNGDDMTPLPPGKRPVATLFQDNNLFPHLDILTNVALGESPLARPSARSKDRARAALEQVGLGGMEMRKPADLSGGQQSRAALARILLTARPIILMDEPFSALGPAQRREMLVLVKDLLPSALILMVTHDPDDAKEAPTTILVADGNVHKPKDTARLFADPPSELERYLR